MSKLNTDTLKQQFIKKIQDMIVSGELKEGEQIPPERELAATLGISRGIISAGMVELAAKGLINIIPRKGMFVASFEEEGTLAALELLMNYADGEINQPLFLDMIEVKRRIESRCAYLAALNRTEGDLADLRNLLDQVARETGIDELTDLNYRFHHRISQATKNTIYSLLDRSFEPVSRNIIHFFYSRPGVIEKSKDAMKHLYECINERDGETAAAYSRGIYDFAEDILGNNCNGKQ